jgi:hypothetical protein
MSTAEKSLRLLVEKWLAPTMATRLRVTRFARRRLNQGRYVRVEVLQPEGAVAIFFFQHHDGTWCVFPPETKRLAMRTR